MRILQGITSVDANDVIPNLGGLYQYPYAVSLRTEDTPAWFTASGKVVEAYTPFVVLEFIDKVAAKYLRVLTVNGEIGTVLHNPRYLKELGQ